MRTYCFHEIDMEKYELLKLARDIVVELIQLPQ